MTTIEQFKAMTTCADCVNGEPCAEGDHIGCEIHNKIFHKGHRCGLGMWAFQDAYITQLYFWNIAQWLHDYEDVGRSLNLIPRSQWPEVADEPH